MIERAVRSGIPAVNEIWDRESRTELSHFVSLPAGNYNLNQSLTEQIQYFSLQLTPSAVLVSGKQFQLLTFIYFSALLLLLFHTVFDGAYWYLLKSIMHY